MRNYFTWLFFLAIVISGCGRNERMDLLYVQRCLNCHGLSGRGDGPMAAALPATTPDFRDTVQRKNNPQIRRIIANGKGIMPAFEPALSQAEINDILLGRVHDCAALRRPDSATAGCRLYPAATRTRPLPSSQAR